MTCECVFQNQSDEDRLGRRDGIYQVYDMVAALGEMTTVP
jgi:hypothetical protein